MSKDELFRSHVESIVFIKYKELNQLAGDEIGVFLHSDWFLSLIKLNKVVD